MRKSNANKPEVMPRHKALDCLAYEAVTEVMGAAAIKLREKEQGWFAHVIRNECHSTQTKKLIVQGGRLRRRPKLRWLDKREEDLKEVYAQAGDTKDRVKQRIKKAMPDFRSNQEVLWAKAGPAVMQDKCQEEKELGTSKLIT